MSFPTNNSIFTNASTPVAVKALFDVWPPCLVLNEQGDPVIVDSETKFVLGELGSQEAWLNTERHLPEGWISYPFQSNSGTWYEIAAPPTSYNPSKSDIFPEIDFTPLTAHLTEMHFPDDHEQSLIDALPPMPEEATPEQFAALKQWYADGHFWAGMVRAGVVTEEEAYDYQGHRPLPYTHIPGRSRQSGCVRELLHPAERSSAFTDRFISLKKEKEKNGFLKEIKKKFGNLTDDFMTVSWAHISDPRERLAAIQKVKAENEKAFHFFFPDTCRWLEKPGMVTVYPGGVKVRIWQAVPQQPNRRIEKRGKVCGQSRHSQRRFRNFLMRVKWQEVVSPHKKVLKAPAFFLTLTYGDDFPTAPYKFAQHRGNLRDKLHYLLHKKMGLDWGAIWKLEFQERGAPHYHFILFLDHSLNTKWLRKKIAFLWTKLLKKDMDYTPEYCRILYRRHLGNIRGARSKGSCVQPIYADNGKIGKPMYYISKYMTKSDNVVTIQKDGEKAKERPETGRIWGVWYKKNIPLSNGVTFDFADPAAYTDFMEGVRRYGKKCNSYYLMNLADGSSPAIFGDGGKVLQEIVDSAPQVVKWQ